MKLKGLCEMKTIRFKRRNGFSLVEATFVMILVLVLSVAYLMSPQIIDTAKRVQTKNDMSTITSAIMIYQANNINQQVPSNLGDLVTGLSAAQSTSGIAQTDFIKRDGVTSDASSFVDSWGNPYIYNSSARTLSSTANGGTPITVNF